MFTQNRLLFMFMRGSGTRRRKNSPFASGTPCRRVTMEESNQYDQQSQAGNAASAQEEGRG